LVNTCAGKHVFVLHHAKQAVGGTIAGTVPRDVYIIFPRAQIRKLPVGVVFPMPYYRHIGRRYNKNFRISDLPLSGTAW
jgi:hypothetical protein